MTEEDARAWTLAAYPHAGERLAMLAALVAEENGRQNLVAPSTLAAIWSRHIADSVQLALLAGDLEGLWADVGSGGGFPGLAVAAVRPGPVLLVEPRARRAEFLARAAEAMGLTNVDVRQARVERVEGEATVLSARAVASTGVLLDMARHLSRAGTLWLLPRGRVSDADRIDVEKRRMVFHVKQSATAPNSSILVLRGRPA